MPQDAPPKVDPDEVVRKLVAGLSRPHPSGGRVVERASLLAAGADFAGALAWIEANGGQPEFAPAPAARSGAYRLRATVAGNGTGGVTPQRFVLPAAAVTPPTPT